jgi:hypothetical protein
MLLYCPGKKCNTIQTHKLRVDTNEAICTSCQQANVGISDIMKTAMKNNGDIFRAGQLREPFVFKCAQCGIDRRAKVVDDKAVCESCLTPFKLAEPMIQAIKLYVNKEPKSE